MNITPEYTLELLSYLPKRPDYETWIRAISAVGNSFDEQTALSILMSRFTDEIPGETEYKLKHRLKNVNFDSLVNLAKQHGYIREKTNFYYYRNRYFSNRFKANWTINKSFTVKKTFDFKEDPELTFRFSDYELEERAAILQYEGKMSRLEAEKIVLQENPDASRERLYRVAVNKQILNKNLNPRTGQPHQNFKIFTTSFKNYILTVPEICHYIGKGFSISCCHFLENINGQIYRKTQNFECGELFAIDVDGHLKLEEAFSLPETRQAIILYTTASHTDEQHRFRLIFSLPKIIPVSYTHLTLPTIYSV